MKKFFILLLVVILIMSNVAYAKSYNFTFMNMSSTLGSGTAVKDRTANNWECKVSGVNVSKTNIFEHRILLSDGSSRSSWKTATGMSSTYKAQSYNTTVSVGQSFKINGRKGSSSTTGEPLTASGDFRP